MSLKIYGKDKNSLFLTMFLDLNGQDYNLHEIAQQSNNNIDAIVEVNDNDVFIKFEIFHNYRLQVDKIQKILNEDKNIYVITNVNIDSLDNPRVIFNDFLFNRTKAYYSQFPFREKTEKWYHKGQLSYIVPEHNRIKNKIYVAPNKTYNNSPYRNLIYRKRIVEILKNNYYNSGYLGNCHDDSQKLFLYSNIEFPLMDLERLEILKLDSDEISPGYSPPHNEYYRNTFISIYGETVERIGDAVSPTLVVTEKTFDPLIKGHFILPFSVPGFIKHLKEFYGFRFPDFIDYSYDNINDDKLRFTAYEAEINRLLNLDIGAWRNYWKINFDNILRYNQMIFQIRPYDRVDFYKF